MSQTTPELTEPERAAFAALLDEVIPPSPERGLPGAGEIGLAGEIDAAAPDLRPVLRQGLAALDEKARTRGLARFTDLARPERAAALGELVAQDPGFLPGIVYHTYARYYQQPPVLEALGLEARPPFPGGYPLEPLDPERLAQIRARPRLWRDG
jgi:hypothetical protein